MIGKIQNLLILILFIFYIYFLERRHIGTIDYYVFFSLYFSMENMFYIPFHYFVDFFLYL